MNSKVRVIPMNVLTRILPRGTEEIYEKSRLRFEPNTSRLKVDILVDAPRRSVTRYNILGGYRRFGRNVDLRILPRICTLVFRVKMGKACSSRLLVITYKVAWCYNTKSHGTCVHNFVILFFCAKLLQVHIQNALRVFFFLCSGTNKKRIELL
jgi:hypothetical protein